MRAKRVNIDGHDFAEVSQIERPELFREWIKGQNVPDIADFDGIYWHDYLRYLDYLKWKKMG